MKHKAYASRAVELINRRCAEKGWTLTKVLDEVNIPYGTFRDWSMGKYNPTAIGLESMALAGYDVIYILTGEKKDVS